MTGAFFLVRSTLDKDAVFRDDRTQVSRRLWSLTAGLFGDGHISGFGDMGIAWSAGRDLLVRRTRVYFMNIFNRCPDK